MKRLVMNGQLIICLPECRSHLLRDSGNDSGTNTLRDWKKVSRPSASFTTNKFWSLTMSVTKHFCHFFVRLNYLSCWVHSLFVVSY